MSNGILTLGWVDVAKGILMAVLGAVVTYLYVALSTPGFAFGTFDWSMMLQVGLLAGVTYLVKNFFSNNSGSFLGLVG